MNPNGSDFRLHEIPALPPDVDVRYTAWSPSGTRLLCQASRFRGDPSLNGVYTIRAADGGGLRRLTANPYPPSGNFGGGDIPGESSPDGRRFVFMRAKPGPEPTPDIGQSGALFVENVDGSGLRQITPYGLANSHDNGLAHWSPDGHTILFAGENGSLLTIRPDGTGLRKIPSRPALPRARQAGLPTASASCSPPPPAPARRTYTPPDPTARTWLPSRTLQRSKTMPTGVPRGDPESQPKSGLGELGPRTHGDLGELVQTSQPLATSTSCCSLLRGDPAPTADTILASGYAVVRSGPVGPGQGGCPSRVVGRYRVGCLRLPDGMDDFGRLA